MNIFQDKFFPKIPVIKAFFKNYPYNFFYKLRKMSLPSCKSQRTFVSSKKQK